MSVEIDWHGTYVKMKIGEIAQEGVREAGESVAAEARRLCPVGTVTREAKEYVGEDSGHRRVVTWTGRRPGDLKKSIRVIHVKKEDAILAYVKAGSKDVHYATFVELGTRKMQASPFLRPALGKARVLLESIRARLA